MSDSFIFIFGMLVFGVAIGSSLISIIGTSQLEEKIKERSRQQPRSDSHRQVVATPLAERPL